MRIDCQCDHLAIYQNFFFIPFSDARIDGLQWLNASSVRVPRTVPLPALSFRRVTFRCKGRTGSFKKVCETLSSKPELVFYEGTTRISPFEHMVSCSLLGRLLTAMREAEKYLNIRARFEYLNILLTKLLIQMMG